VEIIWKCSEVKWGEVKWSVGKGGKTRLWEKFVWAVKWWEVKGWGESVSTVCVGKNTGNCIQYFLTVVLFTFCTGCILRCHVCIVVKCRVCIVVMCICWTMCVLLFSLYMPVCWLEDRIRKVLRPATSTQVFLGFPMSISKCWDGSQHPKLPLHASHVALPT